MTQWTYIHYQLCMHIHLWNWSPSSIYISYHNTRDTESVFEHSFLCYLSNGITYSIYLNASNHYKPFSIIKYFMNNYILPCIYSIYSRSIQHHETANTSPTLLCSRILVMPRKSLHLSSNPRVSDRYFVSILTDTLI